MSELVIPDPPDVAMDALAQQLIDPGKPTLRLRRGVVQDADRTARTLTLRLYGTDVDIAGVRHLDSYYPNVGDVVEVLTSTPTLLVLGRAMPASGAAAELGTVNTSETTTSTVFTDLTTVGPSAVVVAPPTGRIHVSFGCRYSNSSATGTCIVAAQVVGSVSGTQSAANARALYHTGTGDAQHGYSHQAIGLTPGETVTVTLKYRVSAGTGTFQSRRVDVMPITV